MKLATILGAKIAITALFWCVPLLVAPPWFFRWIGIPVPEPLVFARLLGCAYAALLVVYADGLVDARRGGRALPAVHAGIVSNGLASLALAWFGLSGGWASWSAAGRLYMGVSLLATALVTAGLIRARLRGTPAAPGGAGAGSRWS